MNKSVNYECLKYFERAFLEAIEAHDLRKIEIIYRICIASDLEGVQFIKTLNESVCNAKNNFDFDDEEIFTALSEGYMKNGNLLYHLKDLVK